MHSPPSDELRARLVQWRRHLHAHPELGLQEAGTAAFVAARLREIGGIAVTPQVGGHGVVGTMRREGGRGGNRAVGLRADMDALPITEATGLPHASTRPGVMHACGHDGHTAALLGAAVLLAADSSWSGTVHLVFQPAEEGLGGARAMLADGLLTRFPMDRMFGWHNWPGVDAGTVVVHPDAVMAGGARVEISVQGVAGHAAMPHQTRDAVVAAAQLVVALQSVVARTIDPLEPAVVTIGTLMAGEALNQVAAGALLRGTARAHSEAVMDQMESAIARVTEGVAQAFGVTAQLVFRRGAAVTRNRAAEGLLASEAAAAIEAPVRRDLPPSMASEDFGFYLHQVPGAFVWIGSGPLIEGAGLHNPGYDFNDAILPVASAWLAETARRALAG